MKVLNMYSVPIFITELKDQERITIEEYEILSKINLKKREEELQNSTFLSESSQILEHPLLSNIKKTKLKYVNYYINNILGLSNYFKMTTSWLTMNSEGSSHERHSHGNVILSSTLYFCENLFEDHMAPFYISQKGMSHVFENFQFQYNIDSNNEYNSPSLILPTKTNMLVVFPGWMLHGSEPHHSEYKRYCIGSNYFIEDTVGTGYHSLEVKVRVKDTTI